VSTERLILRAPVLTDAAFYLRLLSDPSYIDNIGDRGIRTLDDAIRYVHQLCAHPTAHGLKVVTLKETGEAIGLCGLLERDFLNHRDLGYAFLPEFMGHGFAFESAKAVLSDAQDLAIAAIVNESNHRSKNLLRKLSFEYRDLIIFPSTGELVEYWVRA